MVDVIAWPPVFAVGAENTIVQPIGVSRGLTGGRYASQAHPERRTATMVVAGIGKDLAGAGYVEMFKRALKGGANLTRLSPCPSHWHLATRGLSNLRGAQPIEWVDNDIPVEWLDGADDVVFTHGARIDGIADLTGVWPKLVCSGFPPSRVIAFPSELVTVGSASARVLRVASSDAAGNATLYLDTALPDGSVIVGASESVVYEVQTPLPRSVQKTSGNFSFTFNLLEVFEVETDGFVEVNPWS